MIKVTITEKLLILRGGVEKVQLCPYAPAGVIWCNDRCPKFGEPQLTEDHLVRIPLCQGDSVIVRLEDFADLRSEETKQTWEDIKKKVAALEIELETLQGMQQ